MTTNILHEQGAFYVCRERFGKTNGYAVYKHAGTHAIRVASIGFDGDDGMKRAIAEVARRCGQVTTTTNETTTEKE